MVIALATVKTADCRLNLTSPPTFVSENPISWPCRFAKLYVLHVHGDLQQCLVTEAEIGTSGWFTEPRFGHVWWSVCAFGHKLGRRS